jgi:hypothetical protein
MATEVTDITTCANLMIALSEIGGAKFWDLCCKPLDRVKLDRL